LVPLIGLILVAAICLDGAVSRRLPNPLTVPARRAGRGRSGHRRLAAGKQSEFYREMSRHIRAAKSDGSAVWSLLAISFAYGIFHAAGPGHGKAVISSYLVANEETAKRASRCLCVGADAGAGRGSDCRHLRWLLNATAKTMLPAPARHRDRQLRPDRGVRRRLV